MESITSNEKAIAKLRAYLSEQDETFKNKSDVEVVLAAIEKMKQQNIQIRVLARLM